MLSDILHPGRIRHKDDADMSIIDKIFGTKTNGPSWKIESDKTAARRFTSFTLAALKNLDSLITGFLNSRDVEGKKEVLLHNDQFGNTILHYFALRRGCDDDLVKALYVLSEHCGIDVCEDMKNHGGHCPCNTGYHRSLVLTSINVRPIYLRGNGDIVEISHTVLEKMSILYRPPIKEVMAWDKMKGINANDRKSGFFLEVEENVDVINQYANRWGFDTPRAPKHNVKLRVVSDRWAFCVKE